MNRIQPNTGTQSELFPLELTNRSYEKLQTTAKKTSFIFGGIVGFAIGMSICIKLYSCLSENYNTPIVLSAAPTLYLLAWASTAIGALKCNQLTEEIIHRYFTPIEP
jgi:hypothetical protein